MNRTTYFATVLILLAPVLAGAAELPAALPDQLGNEIALTDLPEQAVLAIVVAGRKLRHVQRWEEALRAELPELVSLRVADVTEEPRPSIEQVAAKLRQRAPAGVSILIDLDNLWASRFALDTGQPCLLLFDSERRLIAQWRGRAKRALVDEVLGKLRLVSTAPPRRANDD